MICECGIDHHADEHTEADVETVADAITEAAETEAESRVEVAEEMHAAEVEAAEHAHEASTEAHETAERIAEIEADARVAVAEADAAAAVEIAEADAAAAVAIADAATPDEDDPLEVDPAEAPVDEEQAGAVVEVDVPPQVEDGPPVENARVAAKRRSSRPSRFTARRPR